MVDELKVISQVEVKTQSFNGQQERSRIISIAEQGRRTKKTLAPACFYCNKPGHLAKACTDVSTLNLRLRIMKANKLCQNCGTKGHMAVGCPCGACRPCGNSEHHTSICKKLYETTEITRTPPATKLKKKPASKSTSQALTTSASAKVNSVVLDQADSEISDVILQVNDNAKSLILVGQVQVLNPTTTGLEPVYAMHDTGADRSFVSTELAERLQLKDVDFERLSIGTFGSNTPMVETCGISVLKVWDASSAPHAFSVTKIDKITDALQRNNLCLKDKRFLCGNDIQLSISPLARHSTSDTSRLR